MLEYPFATEEQKELANMARSILEKELAPRLHELEQANDGKGEFPLDVFKTMAEAGYTGMLVPEKYGGLGFDNVTKCLIYEEMAKVDAGFTFNFNGAIANFKYIEMSHISEEEKQAWADRYIAGEARGACCITEPDAGSDAAGMKTTAVKDGNEWVLNGRKCFVTDGPVADHFVIFAWTDKSQSTGKGITAFFVEKERGVQVGAVENKMGIKLSCTSDIILDNVRVPEDHVIGEVGRGFKYAMQDLDMARICGMVYCLGISQTAIDEATKYAKVRKQFGKRIIDHEGLAFLLADMEIRTDAARALLYQSARCLDEGKPIGSLSSATKVFVSESCVQTAIDGIQALGGYGYMKDYPMEKLLRDAKIFTIFDGTNQIQRMIVGRYLDKKYDD